MALKVFYVKRAGLLSPMAKRQITTEMGKLMSKTACCADTVDVHTSFNSLMVHRTLVFHTVSLTELKGMLL